MEQTSQNKSITRFLALILCAALMAGCAGKRQTAQQRAVAAKALFEQTTRNFHLPSAETDGPEKRRLQAEASRGYRELLSKYSDQKLYASQAERSLGNISAAQGNIDEAVRHYAAVGIKYPGQEWEVLMAWKSAADLLWENGRRPEAVPFYRKLVKRFDTPDATSVMKIAVRASKGRLDSQPG